MENQNKSILDIDPEEELRWPSVVFLSSEITEIASTILDLLPACSLSLRLDHFGNLYLQISRDISRKYLELSLEKYLRKHYPKAPREALQACIESFLSTSDIGLQRRIQELTEEHFAEGCEHALIEFAAPIFSELSLQLPREIEFYKYKRKDGEGLEPYIYKTLKKSLKAGHVQVVVKDQRGRKKGSKNKVDLTKRQKQKCQERLNRIKKEILSYFRAGYDADTLTQRTISRKLGVTTHTIRRWLGDAGKKWKEVVQEVARNQGI